MKMDNLKFIPELIHFCSSTWEMSKRTKCNLFAAQNGLKLLEIPKKWSSKIKKENELDIKYQCIVIDSKRYYKHRLLAILGCSCYSRKPYKRF